MATASSSVLVALKSLFIVLMCIIAAALAYTLVKDGDSSCFDLSALWTQVMNVDVVAFITPVVAWFFYKESSWIKRVVFMIVIFWCGSFVTCGYIVWLLFKLSPEESLKDPIYFVLVRRQNRHANMGRVTRFSHIITAKVIVTAIGCCLLGLIIYAYSVLGFPFYAEVLTPCMITALVCFHVHIVVFSVWIAYKESSWTGAVLWILGLVCFSGFGICVYLVRELSYLSPEQPVFFILFNKNNRDMTSSDPLLVKH
ncbi:uncharacterized protein LOC143605768 [Bidens hawaiensis]|uniref:uncharacterized protein LOC143605768 n=1 Tax=Bidens hawaiensis TaxID=980011 RepID=UPI00404B2129